MEAKVVRENTLKLRFGPTTRNPSNEEIFGLFKEQGWAADDLAAMYREDYCLFVKFKTDKLMKDALLNLGPCVDFVYADGTKITVGASEANGTFKYVRVFGLPPELDDRQVAVVFSRYGNIQQMVRERYPAELGFPIWNGVRGLYIELREEIPAQVFVQHIKARVYHDGMVNKCFKCGSTEHLKANCPARSTVNVRLASYAHPEAGGQSGKVNQLQVPAPVDEVAFPALAKGAENVAEAGPSGVKQLLVRTEPTGNPKRNRVSKTESGSSEAGKAKRSMVVPEATSLLKLQARRSRSMTTRNTASSQPSQPTVEVASLDRNTCEN